MTNWDFEEQINKEFDEWFSGDYGPFSYRNEHFYGDVEIEDLQTRREMLRKWITSSFQEGYIRGMYNLLEQQQKEKELREQKNERNYDLLKESIVKEYDEHWKSLGGTE